MLVEYCIS